MKNMKIYGGLLVHGIPEFRLPRKITEDVISKVLELGIEVNLGKELGKDITLNKLRENYDAVLLCFGANISGMMGIDGENLKRCIWRK